MSNAVEPGIDEIIEQVLAIIGEKLSDEARVLAEAFVRQYYGGTAAEDLSEREPADLYGAALGQLNFLRQRAAGARRVRVFNPQLDQHGWQSTHTIVEVCCDDMPFLVDSIRMALNRRGLTIHLIVHPVMRLRRDADGRVVAVLERDEEGDDDTFTEAVMHFEVDRQAEREVLEEMQAEIEDVLRDVAAAVTDWPAMRERMTAVLAALRESPPPLPESELSEGAAFLEWLLDNHFTLLGYRDYALETIDGEDVLRAIGGSSLGVLRATDSGDVSKSFIALSAEVRALARQRTLLVVTKANSRSTVHRPGYLDYVGVKCFDADGNVVGEHRFLGLYTSVAYNSHPRNIPLLRNKVDEIVRRAGYLPNSHAGKALLNILETYPRDELFLQPAEELYKAALGILHLQERQRIRLFVHRDIYGRYYSCIVYVPRDRFNTRIRERIQEILSEAFGAVSSEFTVQLSESVLARLYFVMRVPSGTHPEYDVHELEARLVSETRSWRDDLYAALLEECGEERGTRLFRRYGAAFRAAYRENYTARIAVHDIERIEQLDDAHELAMSVYRPLEAPENTFHFKLFHRATPISLSDALPMLENMGLRVEEERPSRVTPADGSRIWVNDFGLSHTIEALDLERVTDLFQDAFAHVWSGAVENDGFNRLVLRASLAWREIVILRAYCKYLRQAGVAFSQEYMERTLTANPGIARDLVALFHARFDPSRDEAGRAEAEAIAARIREALERVANLDEDRILRSFLGLVRATLRTNYFQHDARGELKSYVSFKFDPKRIPELPEPRPMFEIWVYSTRVEGVHLRGGPVARGGLRWSDRREDFRTEVLGLVKAQMVKNAVIVPVGSKGGFVPKHLPVGGSREAVLEEGIACYKTFIRGMLDITDNLAGSEVVPPPEVIRHDGDDPYLVVAADKGTATFSDIANSVAAEYQFWLGDAFASGGSHGYDHKKMGITARGAWESVKRHFRELGTNVQSSDFTTVAIGDMAGDVFGNGMLQSRHTRLVAAFNHMHIFIDPTPDAERSFAERERLFNLPRSSWDDYDRSVISEGGGIYPRSAKSINVSPQARAALGIEEESLAPSDLIKAILKAPVDLLWNGGIGTYVKASSQRNAEVGDRANDALRVDGRDLRCRVVGEGGNLGFTQLGRIEYALAGGAINTDAIDNVGGVDCSDHEVNIKILLNGIVQKGDMTEKQRNALLIEMTDDVARLVLRNSYLQTEALSLARAQASSLVEVHSRLIRTLEREGHLDRQIEVLPSNDEFAERRAAGRGLTAPELAVLMAYIKIRLYQLLLASSMPDDANVLPELIRYFPKQVSERYRDELPSHRLSRDIIATEVANGIVNRAGITFAFRLGEETGATPDAIARAWMAARDVFAMPEYWAAVEALDNQVPVAAQTVLLLEGRKLVERASRWLLRNRPQPLDLTGLTERYATGAVALHGALPNVLSEGDRQRFEQFVADLVGRGVPEPLARRCGGFEALYSTFDVVEAAEACGDPVDVVAAVYFELAAALGLDWLRDRIIALPRENRWQTLARAALRDDLYAQQSVLTRDALRGSDIGEDASQRVADWLGRNDQNVQRCRQVLAELRGAGVADFAMMSVAMREIRALGIPVA